VADTNDNLVQIAPVKSFASERSTNLRDHFPFAEIRSNQGPALDVASKWLQSPKKFMVGECPTGFGKSPFDIAVGSYAKTMPGFGQFQPGAYILTPQKTLAEQYMKDFAPMGLVELKGRNNYECDKWTQITGEKIDCETGAMLNESSGMDDKCDFCPYRAAKQRYMAAELGTTNFAYHLNETNHSHQLADRTMLILDEGHNTEDQILSLTDTEIDKKRCEALGISNLPIFDSGDNNSVIQWLDNILVPAVSKKYNELAKAFKDSRDEERAKIAKRINSLDRFLQRVNMFRHSNDPGEWFVWSDWQVNARTGKATGTGSLFIKPLTARLFADDLLFSKSQKVLITSATILDFQTFLRNLGIAEDNAVVLSVDSEFPIEHRPIFFDAPVGSMSYKNIDATLPKMAVAVYNLMKRYGKYKGIVHTNSFKVNRYITQYLAGTDMADRVVTHVSGEKGGRERAQFDHIVTRREEPTVLFSPSMTEGLDLKEDLSRFQIICKVPYPALDPYVTARKDRDPGWYQWQTALKLVQATGRSVRSKTDKAHTHILDSDFANFIRQNNRKLPKYWTNSIIF
jgi:ATP-dependent DNA helicase DinG